MKKRLLSIALMLAATVGTLAQGSYKQPAKEIMDVLYAPAIPTTSISPAGDKIAMFEPLRYPPIAELAAPMLRIAGLRIDPTTNGTHRQPYMVGVRLMNINGGPETTVAMPAGARIVSPQWSPDGKRIAVGNITPRGVELWIIETSNGRAKRLGDFYVNTAFGGFSWEDGETLSATLVPKDRGPAPSYRDVVPTEPNIQETRGRTGTVATFQDLLRSPNDEKLFDYYCTSQIAMIDLKGTVVEIGKPAIFETWSVSPNGRYVLASRVERPYSYQFPWFRFAKTVQIWDTAGKVVKDIAKLPLADNVPSQGVITGPRSLAWVPTEPAMLMWAEALDGGDPKAKVEHRDKLMRLAMPFDAAPAELLRTQHRYQTRLLGERDGLMLVGDYNRDTQRVRMFKTDYRDASNVVLINERNLNDRYGDIGNPVMKTTKTGANVVRQSGDSIFLTGVGSSPEGDRPFLREMNLKTKVVTEIFRSGTAEYEAFVAMIDDNGSQFITRGDSPSSPPNLYLRLVCPAGTNCLTVQAEQITRFTDPSPQLRGITKQLVKYKRADGVDLSFTLYLPPNYKQGTRLPTVVWAYPESFTDASVAGQVAGSTNRFTQIGGISHLFFLLQGYAVLDNTSMPVIGPPETKNDTFIKQIVDAAAAAIDKGVEMGVVDRDRVGVGGHSYGAFMTANLLAHSDLFRSGIARSGAYNRTLTPFGFQDEVRNFWAATNIYTSVSPFYYADKINEPLLMIHGESDNNQGTFPIQSERLYAAISGLGGTARLVMLPHESHGYSARESTEHTLYEMTTWFDKHVKNAKPK